MNKDEMINGMENDVLRCFNNNDLFYILYLVKRDYEDKKDKMNDLGIKERLYHPDEGAVQSRNLISKLESLIIYTAERTQSQDIVEVKAMNKYEMKMIEELTKVLKKIGNSDEPMLDGLTEWADVIAEALYNANCRILADDEVVIKKSELARLKNLEINYEQVYEEYRKLEQERLHDEFKKHEQELARAILQRIYDIGKDTGTICLSAYAIEQFAKAYHIELE